MYSIKINRDIFALTKKILRKQKLVYAYKIAIIKNIKSTTYSRQYIDNCFFSKNIEVIKTLLFNNVFLDRISIKSRRT